MEERRIFPRYSLSWPIAVHSEDDKDFDVVSCNVSVAGMGLSMPRAAVVALAQSGSILTPGDRLQLAFDAPDDSSHRHTLSLLGRVRDVRRLSQEEYLVNVWFEERGPEQAAGLEALVESARHSFGR